MFWRNCEKRTNSLLHLFLSYDESGAHAGRCPSKSSSSTNRSFEYSRSKPATLLDSRIGCTSSTLNSHSVALVHTSSTITTIPRS